MGRVLYFDYCAIAVLILILVCMIVRKMTRGRVNRCFLMTVIVLLAACFCDVFSYYLEITGTGHVLFSHVFYTMSQWLRTLFCAFFTCYVLCQTEIWHKVVTNKVFGGVLIAPVILDTVLLFFVNPFTHWFFKVNENNGYSRGDFYAVLYIISFVYVVICIMVVSVYKNILGFRMSFYLSLSMICILIAFVVQYIWQELMMEMFIVSVMGLVLILTVQAPETRINAQTGLFNANAFLNDLKNYKRLDKKIAIVLVNITNTKSLHDILGFVRYGKLIKDISTSLIAHEKELHLDYGIYYLADGSYGLILDEMHYDSAMAVGQAINAALVRDFTYDGMLLKVMANCCLVFCPQDIDEPDFVLPFSEALTAEAYTGDLRYAEKLFARRDFEIRRDMGVIIDRCIGNNTISLAYQPVFNVEADRFVSVEGFLRVYDEIYGAISPEVVIRCAEKTGDVHGITAFVFDEVCRLISDPNFFGMGIDYVEINLSPVQCMWSDLVAVLLSTMESYNINSSQICINITDVENVQIYSRMADNLKALAKAGIHLYMDDFGAGVFEIERLTELPLDGIKLDREFVDAGTNKNGAPILKSTIKMAKDMGMDVVAVGIETPAMRRKSLDMGCGKLQGYYYAKPMKYHEIIQFLLTR